MTDNEVLLITALKLAKDSNLRALLLESYIQEYGALPDEVGDKVRQILEEGVHEQ